MTLPQFFHPHFPSLSSEPEKDEDTRVVSAGALSVTLPAEEARHATKVLRLKSGDHIRIAFQDTEQIYVGELFANSDGDLSAKLLHQVELPTIATPGLTLIFGLSKGKKNELVIEKATELGVEEIILWQTTNSVSKVHSDKDVQSKNERFSKIALAAAKQCKRSSIPRVSIATSSEKLFEKTFSDSALKMCCSLSEEAIPLSSCPLAKASQVIIAVGPEGDFTLEEEVKLKSHDFQLVSLGENILRSETAAIAALAMTHALFGSQER